MLSIKNKPRINEDPKDAMIREFQEEIKKLKGDLHGARRGDGSGGEKVVVEKVPSQSFPFETNLYRRLE